MKLSVIIIAKNEQTVIRDCLESIQGLADEVILVDSDSSDATIKIAREFTAKIISAPTGDYSQLRNLGLKSATGDWLFYIDADERATPELIQEISQIMRSQGDPLRSYNLRSYKLYRKNIVFGRFIKHAGYWPDPVHRLFKKEALTGWTGRLHESPTVTGKIGLITTPITHYTVRSISAALEKSRAWSAIEAQLLFEANVPKVTWWKIIKAFKLELFRQLILRAGFLDGMPGFVLAYIRAYHQASVLVNLWHFQHQKS